ncbi:TIGR03905 family TSCPD domain-containing protein [Clostridium subterminale]|uniref:ribonucleoside-diphosphate reductase n=1 Tax=Clostridium subterminale TaxID=1550 RepID=A0ABN1KHU0_CLOSU
MKFITSGVCSKEINFDVVDNKIRNVNFVRGCDGNLLGIASLVEGMDIDEVILRLKGIHCGLKDTSCPDQLAKALELFKAKN